MSTSPLLDRLVLLDDGRSSVTRLRSGEPLHSASFWSFRFRPEFIALLLGPSLTQSDSLYGEDDAAPVPCLLLGTKLLPVVDLLPSGGCPLSSSSTPQPDLGFGGSTSSEKTDAVSAERISSCASAYSVSSVGRGFLPAAMREKKKSRSIHRASGGVQRLDSGGPYLGSACGTCCSRR
jgi:hypothetical protein